MPVRLPIVGVMGSGDSSEHAHGAEEIGRWLATESVHLLTGGGAGLMEVVCRAFHDAPGRRGLVIGILPCRDDNPALPTAGYPNPWVELAIHTHLPYSSAKGSDPMSRNHINVLSSDVVVALPGGLGTSSEVQLAVCYGRPVAAYLEARSDIPMLPANVPVFGMLSGVQDFVRAALRAGTRPSA